MYHWTNDQYIYIYTHRVCVLAQIYQKMPDMFCFLSCIYIRGKKERKKKKTEFVCLVWFLVAGMIPLLYTMRVQAGDACKLSSFFFSEVYIFSLLC